MIGFEMSDGVLFVQNVEEWINVQALESTVWCQGICVVPDIQLLVEEPHISFYANTTCMDGFVQRYFAPVVVVRMAGNGPNVAGKVGGPVRESFRWLSRVSPVFEYPIEIIGEERHECAECDCQKLNNAAGAQVSSPRSTNLGWCVYSIMRAIASRKSTQFNDLLFRPVCCTLKKLPSATFS